MRGHYDLLGPQGRPRNFLAMGNVKLDSMWHYWQYAGPRDPLAFKERVALRLLNAEHDLRFNGVPVPAELQRLLDGLDSIIGEED